MKNATMNEKKTLVVKVSESLDESVGYNGLVYDPELVFRPDFKNPTIGLALESIGRYDQIYRAISIPVSTKHWSLSLAALLGEKHGSQFIGGSAAVGVFIASQEQARAIVRGLTDNPQEYYTDRTIEYFERHPEEANALREKIRS